ncbi:MAG: TRAP transporter substrate-binding protein DctP [Mailhella sp.]|nr:TRAP transporter substrate-binding protein DctP [Mailhella sp.]
MKHFKAALSFSLAALLTAASAYAADVFEFNFQSSYRGPHAINVDVYKPWIADLEKKSEGSLILHFFNSGDLVKTAKCGEAVMQGTVDIATVGPTYQDTLFPNTLSMTQQYMYKDCVHATKALWQAYKTIPEIKAEWDNIGHVLCLWASDRYGIFSTKGPILQASDLAGKRVLIWSGSQVSQVKAWGGIPVQTTSNDSYMALQRGMGDVLICPLPAGRSYKLTEVAKDVTVFPCSVLLMGSIMNKDCYAELPDNLKALLDETGGGEAVSMHMAEVLYNSTQKDIDTMVSVDKCTIHNLTDEQYGTFKAADKDVIESYWKAELARLGIKDPEAAMARAHELAEAAK